MKRLIFTLSLAAALFTACGGDNSKTENDSQPAATDSVAQATPIKEFRTFTVSDKLCFIVHDEEPFAPEFATYYVRKRFAVEWPEEGMMTDKAMKELLSNYFNVDPTTDIKKAVAEWRDNVIHNTPGEKVKEIDEDMPYEYSEMHSDCRQDSNIATFSISYGDYNIGAIHGMYAERYLTVDVETGEVIHLSDLLDVKRIGYAVARAIQDLDVNSEIFDCLFDEYKEVNEMPLSETFFIDSTHSTINIIYDPYEITPYCCGVQRVCLPIFWLSKHLKLTPYAKQLFGPENFLKDDK